MRHVFRHRQIDGRWTRGIASALVMFTTTIRSVGVKRTCGDGHDSRIAFSPAMIAAFLAAGLIARGAAADESVDGFRLPDGFAISLYADDELAHDIFSLTLDSAGRAVVAGQGYVKTLHDDDGDGRADRATIFTDQPKEGARGLTFDGSSLVTVGDNMLARWEDADGDLRADGPPQVLSRIVQTGGHSSNGVIRGPDGWFYIACGNDAGVTAEHATRGGSPVREPLQGTMFRVSPDGSSSEIVADGFRNPYDLDFDWRGGLFTVDADGERDQFMPWYSPTRLFDVATGWHHGWMLPGWIRSWNRPPRFFDNTPRLVEIGRGSPTGLIVYRHRQFPAPYRGGVFSCCWSLGRVYFFPLTPDGASYESERTVFLEATGGGGFAPCGMEVGPDGDLFIAIGGRGTRGGVYRVRYVGKANDSKRERAGDRDDADDAKPTTGARSPIDSVLHADQPLTAWSRARWMPMARELGAEPFQVVAADAKRGPADRVRAIEILVEMFDGLSVPVAERILEATAKEASADDASAESSVESAKGSNAPAEVVARIAWALARKPPGGVNEETGLVGAEVESLLARLTHDRRPWVARHAWESLASLPKLGPASREANWPAGGRSSDRRVRAAAILAIVRSGDLYEARLDYEPQAEANADVLLPYLWRQVKAKSLAREDAEIAITLLEETESNRVRSEAIRVLQIALGDVRVEPTEPDVYAGYQPNRPDGIEDWVRRSAARVVAERFPSENTDVDREAARLLGMLQLEVDGLPERLLDRITGETTVEDDIHYLIVLSRLPGSRTDLDTQRTAAALAELPHKMRATSQQPSRFWPERVGEMFQQLCRHDVRLASALADHAKFNSADHAFLAERMADDVRRRAARRLATIVNDAGGDWSESLVRAAGSLPPNEHRTLLRPWCEETGLRDAILEIFAESPDEADRAFFVAMLAAPEPASAARAARALVRLPARPAKGANEKDDDTARRVTDEWGTAFRAVASLVRDKQSRDSASAIFDLLGHWTGKRIDVDSDADQAKQLDAWRSLLLEARPELREHFDAREESVAEFLGRLASIDWEEGDATRGEKVFQRRSCARCHIGASRLGPELTGVANRFSRDDLMAAVVDPNRDVSPAYRITQIVTADGRVFAGQVIYESPEATMLQIGADETIRITGVEIVDLRKGILSPMPTGLLRDATDEEVADLYAYLRMLERR